MCSSDLLPPELDLTPLRGIVNGRKLPPPPNSGTVTMTITNEPAESPTGVEIGYVAEHFQMYFALVSPAPSVSLTLVLDQEPPDEKDPGWMLSSFNCMLGKAPPG